MRHFHAPVAIVLAAGIGCSNVADHGEGEPASRGGQSASAGSSGHGGAAPAGSGGAAAGLPSGGAGSGSGGTSAMTSGGSAGSGGTSTTPAGPQDLPAVTGTCPDFGSGEGDAVLFAPAGLAVDEESGEPRPAHLHQRPVNLFFDPAVLGTKPGPLVFYWHWTSGDVGDVNYALTEDAIDAIEGEGGIVAVPDYERDEDDSPLLTFSWYIANGERAQYDLLVADEVVACAVSQGFIDTRRVHSIGLSAGGMQTTYMAYARSSYHASGVSYSGALPYYPDPIDPENRFAMLATHGGPDDTGGSLNFMETTLALRDDLEERGHFTVICDDAPNGHGIPESVRPHGYRFLADHPYRVDPEPYAAGLPDDFPAICEPTAP